MDKYYVNNNPQPTGEHEVHKENCDHFPGDYKYLGEYSKCQGAIEKAKEIYENVDGCYWCCRECHTR